MIQPTATEIEGETLGGALAATFAGASPSARKEAVRRVQVLRLVQHCQSIGMSTAETYLRVHLEHGESRRTVQRWRGAVGESPRNEWAARLLPAYKPTAKRKGIVAEAWQWLLSDYHRPQQPAFEACYRRLQDVATVRGWRLPSVRSLKRRYDREVAPSVGTVRRKGVEALEKSLPTQRRDKRDLEAMQWVNADGHKFDVLVQWPMRDGSAPRITRPTMVAWQDVYSGKFLAWRIDETENVDAVRLAFADMVREYGIPEHAVLDNGHAFANKRMTGGMLGRHRFKFREDEQEGIYKAFGVQTHFAIPYRGRSKPIERAFRDLCESIAKHPACAGAYTGNAPHNKPEDYGSRAMPVEEFIALVHREMHAHNARLGRRSQVCAGRSLDEAFDASYSDASRIIRRATEAQLRWLLLPVEGIKVPLSGQCVIRLLGNVFWHESLLDLRGHTITVRFDPHDVKAGLWVFRPGELEPACHATCIEATGFGATEEARRTERARRAIVRAKKLEAAAVGTLSAHELVTEPEKPKQQRKRSSVVAVDFTPRRKVPTAARKAMEQEAADDLVLEVGRNARRQLAEELGLAFAK